MSRHPVFELGGAVAGEDEVAVTVDEAGDDAAALGVQAPVGIRRRAGVADPLDAIVLDHDGGVGPLGGAAARPPGRW